MNYRVEDYTFWGLFSHGVQKETLINTLAYVIALVDGAENGIADPKTAIFVLRYLFEAEEQAQSASELASLHSGKYFPKAYYPQTPVMLTLGWSPISAMLECGWKPLALARQDKNMACASSIWESKRVENALPYEQCAAPEELFWHVLDKAAQKAKSRGLLLSIAASPGWSYKSNIGRPGNLTLAEAQKADRVIWQRTAEK